MINRLVGLCLGLCLFALTANANIGGGSTGGAPGGSNGQLQYNNNGSFGGIPQTSFDPSGSAANVQSYFTGLMGYLDCNGSGCTAATTIPSGALGAANHAPVYLYSLTNNNDATGAYTYTSIDQLNLSRLWKGANSNIYSVTSPPNALRDPRLLVYKTASGQNLYYYTFTCSPSNLSYAPTCLVSSPDLQTWTTVPTPNWSAYTSSGVWTGCWFVDPVSGNTYLFWSIAGGGLNSTPSGQYMVQFYPATGTFGTPQALTFSPNRPYNTPMAVWYASGSYYALLQTFGTTTGGTVPGTRYVELATTTSLSSGAWTIAGLQNWAGWGTSIEGGAITVSPSGLYTAYFVDFGGGNVYYSTSTTPSVGSSWSARQVLNVGLGQISMSADWVDVVPLADVQTDLNLSVLKSQPVYLDTANLAAGFVSSASWGSNGYGVAVSGGSAGVAILRRNATGVPTHPSAGDLWQLFVPDSTGMELWNGTGITNKFYTDGHFSSTGVITAPVTVTASATPALVASNPLQVITLNGDAVPTLSGLSPGQHTTVEICQPATFPAACTGGGSANTYCTWAWPAAIHGGMTIGTNAGTCSIQSFDSFSGTTLVAESTGVTNVAP